MATKKYLGADGITKLKSLVLSAIDEHGVPPTDEQVEAAVTEYLEEHPIQIETATENTLGGIKAAAKTSSETVEVKIGSDGKLYVPEGGSGGGTAAETSYDNSDSGLTADNVQDAIDELNDAIPTGSLASLNEVAESNLAPALKSKINGKVDVNQGTAHAGKVLGIGDDGMVIPVTGGGGVDSVNGQTGAVVLDAEDVGAIASNQGSENAGKVLGIGTDGIVTPVTGGGVYQVDDVLSDTSTFPVQNKVINAALGTLKQLHDASGAGLHNSIYRGRYLGDTYTSAQSAAISNGTFDDLWIGDYWTIGNVNYRIAAFDYYLHCGDDLTTHHAVIVPDTVLYDHVMNDIDTTASGYVGSKMYTQGLTQAKTTIKAAFNSRVLNHKIFLVNAVSSGNPTAGAWCDSEVDLMSEQMVYGARIFSPAPNGTNDPVIYRVEKSQLPLFAHDHSRITNRAHWWLRDANTAATFVFVSADGTANFLNASTSGGVRPAFCIY